MTLSARLREETRDLHAAIEHRVDVIRPDLSLKQYCDLLQRFYGFYAPLEFRLDGAAGLTAACLDFESRRKVLLLEVDLATLGLTTDEIASLTRCSELPNLASTGRILGCLYVTEGATLGGAIISRHVSATLQFEEGSGSAFFTSYGEQRGAMWRALVDLLNALPVEEHTHAIVAARQTFMVFTSWLEHLRRQ